jgi:hypothetical protein
MPKKAIKATGLQQNRLLKNAEIKGKLASGPKNWSWLLHWSRTLFNTLNALGKSLSYPETVVGPRILLQGKVL